MEPILSKQEIADLLSTLQQREPAADVEFDAAGISDASDYSEIDLVHFHTDRHAPVTIPNFDIIMELFGDYYSSALSQTLQYSIQITETSIEYQRFNTYLFLEHHPGAIGLIKIDPLKYSGLITFSPQLTFSLLELMLGGSLQPDSSQPERTATKIELSVLESLMQQGCSALEQALMPVVQVEAKLVKTTHDRRLVSLINPDTELVVCTLQVQIEHLSDTMQLVLPTQSFSPYREALDNLQHLDDLAENDWSDPLSTAVSSMPCSVMAQAAVIDMTIRDLIALETGDVLMLACNPAKRLKLLVEGKHKFSGYLKIQNSKRYVHIIDAVE